MKYFYAFLIFIFGIVAGRWSASVARISPTHSESMLQAVSNTNITPETNPAKHEINSKHVEEDSLSKNSDRSQSTEASQKLLRSDVKAKDKKIRELFSLLIEANEKENSEEQNRLFIQMEKLDPQHETVFQARAMFLQDDENWDGAHEVLKECVSTAPNSVYCNRRLANIRSSTIEDKLYYGTQCLQIAPNDPLCLVDVAMALQLTGEFAKAKTYFELALRLPSGSEGYHKDYILYQYGLNLESLNLYQKAEEAFGQACRLNMKSACQKLKT